MAETPEYSTLKRLVPQLRLTVQPHLLALSGHFLASELITEEEEAELRNESKSKASRAADLISMIMNKVKLNPVCSKQFIDILKNNGVTDIDNLIMDTPLELAECQAKPKSKRMSPTAEVSKHVALSSTGTQTVSTNQMQHKLEVECECRICTSVLKPHSLGVVNFPLLNPDERGKEDFEFQLKRDTKYIMMQFHGVESGLYNTVCDEVPIERLKFHLNAVKALQSEQFGESIFNNYEDQLQAATNADTVFGIACKFWSFLDYDLLEHLIEFLGNEDDKQRMVKYRENFDQYTKRRISECPGIEPSDDDKWENVYIKLDSKLEAITINELREFRFKASEIVGIHVSAIHFCCVKRGCIQVMWQIPCFIKQIIFPLCPEKENMLKLLGVTQLSCLDYIYTATKANQQLSASSNLKRKFKSDLTVPDSDSEEYQRKRRKIDMDSGIDVLSPASSYSDSMNEEMDQKVLDFYRQNIEFFGQEEIKELVYKDVPTMLYWKQLLTGCDVGLEDTSVQQIRRRLVEADTRFQKFGDILPQEFASQYIPNPFSSDESALSVLCKILKDTYKSHNFFNKAGGPGIGRMKFVNLAVVKKKNITEDEKERDRFLKETLHGLIDDIMKKKEHIKVDKIFSYEGDYSRKLVLVEGAPGVGKTMLALKLCSDWGKGEALQEYNLVILVQLRRFQGMEKITLEDVIRVYLDQPELAREVSKELFKTYKKVLLILEGWDELPPRLRKEMTFFYDIITGDKLPNASVMVTSRPTVTADLYNYMDERHIEVLGFTQDEVELYVREHAKSKAVSVLEHLNQFPNLKALAHIPLTLAIICRLARDKIELPPTLTELYNNHICSLLHQNLKKSISLLGVEGLNKLSKENREVIESLCKLALQGMEEKTFVFNREDLENVGLVPKENFDGYGLLSTPIVAATVNHKVYYQFSHLSIQEFLAAYQIQRRDSTDRIRLLKELREDKQFQNVWKFLSGITKLRDKEFQESIISNTTANNRDQMFLIHCLYEAHDSEICLKGAAKLEYNLNINNMSLNTTDCLCAAYAITTAGGEWMVDLRGCNIGADGMGVFKSHFESHLKIPEAERTDFKIKELVLTHNRITQQAVVHLAEILKMDIHVAKILLGSNPLREDGLALLADTLSENKTVTSIHFSYCELTPVCGEHIANMLKKNETLKELYLGFEPLGDEGVCSIVSALKDNSTLIDLSLIKSDFSVESLKCMAEMIPQNKSLKLISLDRNGIGPDECPIIADIIAKSESLVLIDMSKNPIGNRGFEILLDALIAKPKGPIKKLGVFGCQITSKSLTKLVKYFAVTEVFQGIQLGCNELREEGAELVGKALQANISKSVEQVLLESTDIPQGAWDRLAKIVETLKVDREKLDINYMPYAHVVEKRNITNAI